MDGRSLVVSDTGEVVDEIGSMIPCMLWMTDGLIEVMHACFWINRLG